MTTTFTGTYTGAAGTGGGSTAGIALTLPNSSVSYTFTNSAEVTGGLDYNFAPFASYIGSGVGGAGGVGVELTNGGSVTNAGWATSRRPMSPAPSPTPRANFCWARVF